MIYSYEVTGVDKLLSCRYEKRFETAQRAFDYVSTQCTDEYRFDDIAVEEVRYASERNDEKHFNLDSFVIWSRYFHGDEEIPKIIKCIEKHGTMRAAHEHSRL